jgi:hypothetical protein
MDVFPTRGWRIGIAAVALPGAALVAHAVAQALVLPLASCSRGIARGDAYTIVRLTPGRPQLLETMTEAERRIVDAHFQYLMELRDRGVVMHAGRTTDPARLWGIVLMRARPEEAERLMRNDPAIRAGIQRGEFFPYRIALGPP